MEEITDLHQQDINEIKSTIEEDQVQDELPTDKKSMWKARKQKIIGATRMRYNLLIHRSKTKLENSESYDDVHSASQQPDITFKRIKKLNREGEDGISDQSTDGGRSKQVDGSQDGSGKSLDADDRSDDGGKDKSRHRRHRHRHRNKLRAKTLHNDGRDLDGTTIDADILVNNDDSKLQDEQGLKSKRRGRERVKERRQRKQAIEMVSADQMANIIPKDDGRDSQISTDDFDNEFKDSPSSDDDSYVRVDSSKRKKKSKKYLDVSLPNITTKPRSQTYHPIYRSSSRVDKDDDNVSVKSRNVDGDHKSTLPLLVQDDKRHLSDSSSIRGRRSRASSRDYNSTSALKSAQLDTKQQITFDDSSDSHQDVMKDQTKNRDVKFADVDSSSDHSSETYRSIRQDRIDEKKESSDKASRVNRALELLKSIDDEIALVRQELKDEAEEIRSTTGTKSSPKRSRQKQAKTESVLSSFNAGLAFINSLKSRTDDHGRRQLSSAPITEKEEKSAILRKTDQFRVDYTKLYANKFIHDDRYSK